MNSFANLYGYSDVEPYEIVRVVSDKCIEIRAMKAERDLSGPELVFHVGGFSANCSNQRDQKWFISSDESEKVIKARLRKDGNYYSAYGKHKVSDKPIKFYDFNF